jgi:hypothetical protein
MMQGMARMAGKDWGALTQWDRTLMERRASRRRLVGHPAAELTNFRASTT